MPDRSVSDMKLDFYLVSFLHVFSANWIVTTKRVNFIKVTGSAFILVVHVNFT